MSDPDTGKSRTREAWDRSAEGWHRHAPQLRAWLHPATQAMLDMAGVAAGQRVLDVAAGAGDQTLDIAARVGSAGHVLATDLSPAILALAQGNARHAGLAQVSTRVADAQDLGVEPAGFDAVVCRLGLMLFPDPALALREMHRALRPGGGICTMVFSRPERNSCITTIMGTSLEHAGLPPRDPAQAGGLLSLGRPGLLDEMFRAAGFRDVATTLVDAPFRWGRTRDYVDFLRASASPVQQLLGGLDDAARQRAWSDIETRLMRFEGREGFVGPNELALTAARR